MAGFKFRLQKVLKVREIQEEQSKHRWAHEERLAHEERSKLTRLQEHQQQVKVFGYGQETVVLRQAMYEYLEARDRRLEEQTQRVAEQEAAASRAKEAWMKARQERKKVSILRDRQHAAFVQEELRKEQKVLDDMRSRVLS